MEWSSGGYVDAYGVQSDGGLVFLKRINTHQGVENANEGNPDQHDGMTITLAGSGLHTYSVIRLVNKSGRFHLTGLGFVPHLDGTEGTGMVNANQITQASALGFAPTASPSFTEQVYSSGAFYTDGNRSVIRGVEPTLYFRDTNARSGMIHMNSNRMYFLSGGTDTESWTKTANGRWPLYLQTDTNAAVFGGDIDASTGTVRADTFIADYEFKTQDAGVVKHGGVLAMDRYTWRRVVPQRWSGYIVWTPLQNDRSALAMRVVMNSNAGNGSRDWRIQTDYYDSNQYIESRWNGGWLEFRKAGTNSGLGFQTHYYHVTMYGAFI